VQYTASAVFQENNVTLRLLQLVSIPIWLSSYSHNVINAV